MTRAYEDRSSYSPESDAVGAVSLTVECNPGQVQAVIDFLVNVRDCAGVYSVDFTHDVRVPEAQPVLEIVTLAALADIAFPADTADSNINVFAPDVQEAPVAEGEVHGESELQQADDPAQTSAGIGSEAAAVEPATDIDAAKDSSVAGTAGEVGAGSSERDS